MEIRINVEKKHFFVLLFVILLMGVAVYVRAFNTNNPPVFGHSPGEIDWSQEIPTNKIEIGSDSQGIVLRTDDTSNRIQLDVRGVPSITGGPDYSKGSIYLGDVNRGDNNVIILGNLGVGTKFPEPYKLNVLGDAKISGKLRLPSSFVYYESCAIIRNGVSGVDHCSVGCNTNDILVGGGLTENYGLLTVKESGPVSIQDPISGVQELKWRCRADLASNAMVSCTALCLDTGD